MTSKTPLTCFPENLFLFAQQYFCSSSFLHLPSDVPFLRHEFRPTTSRTVLKCHEHFYFEIFSPAPSRRAPPERKARIVNVLLGAMRQMRLSFCKIPHSWSRVQVHTADICCRVLLSRRSRWTDVMQFRVFPREKETEELTFLAELAWKRSSDMGNSSVYSVLAGN